MFEFQVGGFHLRVVPGGLAADDEFSARLGRQAGGGSAHLCDGAARGPDLARADWAASSLSCWPRDPQSRVRRAEGSASLLGRSNSLLWIGEFAVPKFAKLAGKGQKSGKNRGPIAKFRARNSKFPVMTQAEAGSTLTGSAATHPGYRRPFRLRMQPSYASPWSASHSWNRSIHRSDGAPCFTIPNP